MREQAVPVELNFYEASGNMLWLGGEKFNQCDPGKPSLILLLLIVSIDYPHGWVVSVQVCYSKACGFVPELWY